MLVVTIKSNLNLWESLIETESDTVGNKLGSLQKCISVGNTLTRPPNLNNKHLVSNSKEFYMTT